MEENAIAIAEVSRLSLWTMAMVTRMKTGEQEDDCPLDPVDLRHSFGGERYAERSL